MVKHFVRSLGSLSIALVISLTGCAPHGGPAPAPPAAPVIKAALVNATFSAGAPGTPKIMYGFVNWQTADRNVANFAYGWREDVLVGNKSAFQMRVEANLAQGQLIVRDGNLNELPRTDPAISNNGGTVSPGNAGFVAPNSNNGAYSVSLVLTCNDAVSPSYTHPDIHTRNATCAPGEMAGTALVVTLGPDQSVACGVTTPYTLAMRNSGGESRTRFDAVRACPVPAAQSSSLRYVGGGCYARADGSLFCIRGGGVAAGGGGAGVAGGGGAGGSPQGRCSGKPESEFQISMVCQPNNTLLTYPYHACDIGEAKALAAQDRKDCVIR